MFQNNENKVPLTRTTTPPYYSPAREDHVAQTNWLREKSLPGRPGGPFRPIFYYDANRNRKGLVYAPFKFSVHPPGGASGSPTHPTKHTSGPLKGGGDLGRRKSRKRELQVEGIQMEGKPEGGWGDRSCEEVCVCVCYSALALTISNAPERRWVMTLGLR